MDIKSRLLNSSFYRILGNLFRIVITFLMTPFLIASLGSEQYGLWLLVVAAVAWFQVLDFGLSTAIQRRIAIAFEEKDDNEIAILYSCSVVVFIFLAAIAATLFFLLSLYPQLIGVDLAYLEVAGLALAILSIKVFWDMCMNIFHGFYTGLIRFDIDANINTVNEVIKALLLFALVMKLQILGAVLATMMADLIANLLKIIYAKKLYPNMRFEPSLVASAKIRSLFSYSKHVIAIDLAKVVGSRIDPLIISHILGFSALAIFGVAQRLVLIVEELILSVVGMFFPVLTRMSVKNSDLNEATGQLISLNTSLIVAGVTPLIIMSEDFIQLWLGSEFSQSSTLVFPIALVVCNRAVSRPVSDLLMAKAKHQIIALVKMSSIALFIPTAILLGTSYGLIGVAWAAVISTFVADVLMHLYLLKRYKMAKLSLLIISYVKMVSLIGCAMYFRMAVMGSVNYLNWFELIFYSGIISIVAVGIAWTVCLPKSAQLIISGAVVERIRQ